MEHIPFVHPDTVKYMKKHKQGMWSKEDKKLVKDNTPKKEIAKKMKSKKTFVVDKDKNS
jgi:hypothetical protein